MFNLVDHFHEKINKKILILTIIYPLIMVLSIAILMYSSLIKRIGFNTNMNDLYNYNMCTSENYIYNKRSFYTINILQTSFFSNIYIVIVSLVLFIWCFFYFFQLNKNIKKTQQQENKAMFFIQELMTARKLHQQQDKLKRTPQANEPTFKESYGKIFVKIIDVPQKKQKKVNPYYVQSINKLTKFRKKVIILVLFHMTLMLANIITFHYLAFFIEQYQCRSNLQIGWLIFSGLIFLVFIFLIVNFIVLFMLINIWHQLEQKIQFEPLYTKNEQLNKFKQKINEKNDQKKYIRKQIQTLNSQTNQETINKRNQQLRKKLLKKNYYNNNDQLNYPDNIYQNKLKQNQNSNLTKRNQSSPYISSFTPIKLENQMPHQKNNLNDSNSKVIMINQYDSNNMCFPTNPSQIPLSAKQRNKYFNQTNQKNNQNNTSNNNEQKYKISRYNFRKQAQIQLKNKQIIDLSQLNIYQYQQELEIKYLTPQQQKRQQQRFKKYKIGYQRHQQQLILAQQQYQDIRKQNKNLLQQIRKQKQKYKLLYDHYDESQIIQQNSIQNQKQIKIPNLQQKQKQQNKPFFLHKILNNFKKPNQNGNNSQDNSSNMMNNNRQPYKENNNNYLNPNSNINQIDQIHINFKNINQNNQPFQDSQNIYNNWKIYKKQLTNKMIKPLQQKQDQLKLQQLKKKQRFQKLYKGKFDFNYQPNNKINKKTFDNLFQFKSSPNNKKSKLQNSNNNNLNNDSSFLTQNKSVSKPSNQYTFINQLNQIKSIKLSSQINHQNINPVQTEIDYLARQMYNYQLYKKFKEKQRRNGNIQPYQTQRPDYQKPKRTLERLYDVNSSNMNSHNKSFVDGKQFNKYIQKQREILVFKKPYQIGPNNNKNSNNKRNTKSMIQKEKRKMKAQQIYNKIINSQQKEQKEKQISFDQQQEESQEYDSIKQQSRIIKTLAKQKQDQVLKKIRLKKL